MRKIFAVLLLIVIWNSTVPADILAQSERFLGAWTLVEWTNVRDGEIFYPYGEDPIGQIVYTESGRMTAVLLPSPVPGEFPSQFVGYWGGFSVQSEAGTVTHHVEGSSRRGAIVSSRGHGCVRLSDESAKTASAPVLSVFRFLHYECG